MPDRVDAQLLRLVAHRSAAVAAGADPHDVLQTLTDAAVETLGFPSAAGGRRGADGHYEIVAVSGPADEHRTLDGLVISSAALRETIASADGDGPVRIAAATPWHSGETLVAPLGGDANEPIGVLTVAVPASLHSPEHHDVRAHQDVRELLAMLVTQASLVLDNSALRTSLQAEQHEVRRERAHLRASEAAMRFSFAQSADGMARVGLLDAESLRFLEVNDAFCTLAGRTRTELLATTWPGLLRSENVDHGRNVVDQFVAGTRSNYRTEVPIDRPDGTTVWLTLVQNRIDSDGELPPFLLVHAQDVSEQRFREQELRRRAHYDDLTGLANRRTLLQSLDAVVARARERRQSGALLFCDLNRFKPVNDRFGHAAGDQALREVAERLTALVRTQDVVGRLGGDEFLVIVRDVSAGEAEDMAQRIRTDLERPLASVPASIGVSIGVVGIEREDEAVDDLLQRADDAMYADKLAVHRRAS